MGDTFTDAWADQVPEQIGDFKFVNADITKWSGNYYRYEREVPGEELNRLVLRSHSPNKLDLSGEILLRKPGFEIRLSTFRGDYDSAAQIWKPAVEFDSIDACLQTLLRKFQEMKQVMDGLQVGEGWEGED